MRKKINQFSARFSFIVNYDLQVCNEFLVLVHLEHCPRKCFRKFYFLIFSLAVKSLKI